MAYTKKPSDNRRKDLGETPKDFHGGEMTHGDGRGKPGPRDGGKPSYRGSNGDKPGYRGNNERRGNDGDKPGYRGNNERRFNDGDKPGYRGNNERRGNDGDKPGYRGNNERRGNDGDKPGYRGNNERRFNDGDKPGYRGNNERRGNDGDKPGYRGNNERRFNDGDKPGYRGNNERRFNDGDKPGYRGNNERRGNDGDKPGYRGNNERRFNDGDKPGYRGNNERRWNDGDKPGYRGNNERRYNDGDKPGYRGNNERRFNDGDKTGYRGNNERRFNDGDKPGYRGNNGDKPGYRGNNGDKPGYRGNNERKFDERKPKTETPAQAAPETRADELPYLVMGRNAVREALKAGKSIDKLLVQREPDGALRELVSMARDNGIRVDEVGREKLDEMCMPFGHGQKTGNHQGIVAQVPGVEYCEIADMLSHAKEAGRKPFIILLDGIEDPHNLGSIIRSAVCAGADGIIIPSRRSVSVTAAACKASAGAVEYARVARVSNINGAIDRLKDEGLWIAGADMGGEPMTKCRLEGAIALVIGGEGNGISRLTKEKCDFLVKIPMFGELDSLNASVAAAVLMFEKRRQDEAK